MAAPPVGISKICSFLLSQVITWNSSTCAWRSRPPAGSGGGGVFGSVGRAAASGSGLSDGDGDGGTPTPSGLPLALTGAAAKNRTW